LEFLVEFIDPIEEALEFVLADLPELPMVEGVGQVKRAVQFVHDLFLPDPFTTYCSNSLAISRALSFLVSGISLALARSSAADRRQLILIM
jgi:hypothetical protein